MNTQSERFAWICPSCGHQNDDNIDPEYGPFFTAVCSECGDDFDQTTVSPKYYTLQSVANHADVMQAKLTWREAEQVRAALAKAVQS